MVPKAGSPPALALLVFGLACLAVLAHRAVRTHALTHRPADLLVVAGCAWLGVSLFSQLVMGPGNVAFYSGHALELGGIALIGIPTALDLARGGASRPLVGDLTAHRAGRRRGGLPRHPRAVAARAARRPGHVDRGAHPPRRPARRARRRGAQAAGRDAPPPRRRRAAARHRQAQRAAGDPPEARLADRRGVRRDPRHPESGRRLLDELGGFSGDRQGASSPTTTSGSTAPATRAG